MFDIQHENTSNDVAYDAPIAQIWINLPSGAKLFFADVEYCEYDNDTKRAAAVEKVKDDIKKMLAEIQSMPASN